MSQEFPVLFTIDGSNRHEVILVSSGLSLNDLSSKIEGIAKESPNTQEVGYQKPLYASPLLESRT